MQSRFDESFLRRAIELADTHMRSGHGGPFGAVVVRDGRVVGEGWNRVTSVNDPTAHAEVVAIRAACAALGTFSLADCTLYASCEPCPMCLGAIHWARIGTVYYAADRHDAAAVGFDDEALYRVLAGEAAGPALYQMLQAEGVAVMQAWRNLPGRVQY